VRLSVCVVSRLARWTMDSLYCRLGSPRTGIASSAKASGGTRRVDAVERLHVAGYIEELTRARSAPTAKQRLSAIRHLFDWFVVG
jgi:site-specific recombinase XerD